MDAKSILMYVLALLLIGITGVNLYATMTSKKRKEKSNQSFQKRNRVQLLRKHKKKLQSH